LGTCPYFTDQYVLIGSSKAVSASMTPYPLGAHQSISTIIVAARHGGQLAAQLPGSDYSVLQARPDQALNLLSDGHRAVVVVDCRGALNECVSAVEVLGAATLQHGLPLLVLVRRVDQAILPTLFTLGATHFLPAPFTELELAQAVKFAHRYFDRLRSMDVPSGSLPMTRPIDAATGLATEVYARDRIDQLIDVESQGGAAALVIIAISRFTRINSRFGRSFADKLLRAVAQRLLRLAVNSTLDVTEKGRRHAIRMGGAEFALLLEPPFDLRDAVMLAQQVIDIFERPFVIDSVLVHLGCRAGIATVSEADESADSLFKKASKALEDLKLQGPNHFAVYDPTIEEAPTSDADLEADLRLAIKEGALDVVFQPQINLVTGAISGFEALARWTHPKIGAVATEAFLNMAEDLEILPQLGELILRVSLGHAQNWSQNIAVNVAPAQLRLLDFDTQLEKLLRDAAFDPQRLTLEITETALIDDFESIATMMSRIKRLGVRLAIDDFGTGHASYSYLKQLPFDYLKIDRSFIQGIAKDRRDRAMVKSIIEMAATLGMAVVAEGVETQIQAELLAREGCTAYQGYLCSEPMKAERVSAFIADWPVNGPPGF
jgi:diguanylate cyclase (GGDEF)-like protein